MTQPALTRPELIARMADLFRARGFAGTTLSDLARITGLKRATLYHHFPGGKSAMAASVLNDAVADLDAHAFRELAGAGSVQVRLAAFVVGFGRYCRGGTRACAISALAMGADAATLSNVRAQFDRWIDLLAALFRTSPATDPKALAVELLADLYGALHIAILRGNAHDFQSHLGRINTRYRQTFNRGTSAIVTRSFP